MTLNQEICSVLEESVEGKILYNNPKDFAENLAQKLLQIIHPKPIVVIAHSEDEVENLIDISRARMGKDYDINFLYDASENEERDYRLTVLSENNIDTITIEHLRNGTSIGGNIGEILEQMDPKACEFDKKLLKEGELRILGGENFLPTYYVTEIPTEGTPERKAQEILMKRERKSIYVTSELELEFKQVYGHIPNWEFKIGAPDQNEIDVIYINTLLEYANTKSDEFKKLVDVIVSGLEENDVSQDEMFRALSEVTELYKREKESAEQNNNNPKSTPELPNIDGMDDLSTTIGDIEHKLNGVEKNNLELQARCTEYEKRLVVAASMQANLEKLNDDISKEIADKIRQITEYKVEIQDLVSKLEVEKSSTEQFRNYAIAASVAAVTFLALALGSTYVATQKSANGKIDYSKKLAELEKTQKSELETAASKIDDREARITELRESLSNSRNEYKKDIEAAVTAAVATKEQSMERFHKDVLAELNLKNEEIIRDQAKAYEERLKKALNSNSAAVREQTIRELLGEIPAPSPRPLLGDQFIQTMGDTAGIASSSRLLRGNNDATQTFNPLTKQESLEQAIKLYKTDKEKGIIEFSKIQDLYTPSKVAHDRADAISGYYISLSLADKNNDYNKQFHVSGTKTFRWMINNFEILSTDDLNRFKHLTEILKSNVEKIKDEKERFQLLSQQSYDKWIYQTIQTLSRRRRVE